MRARGYTLIEVLLVVTVILTLATIGTVSFLETLRQGKEHACFVKMQELAALQQIYFRDFETYATFLQLQDEGLIASQFVEDDTLLHNPTDAGGLRAAGFIGDYQLDISADANTFRILAKPVSPAQGVVARWRLLGRNEDLRSMVVSDDNVVRYASNNRPVK